MSDDTYPNAGRDSGYTDDAGRPVGENIVNVVTGHITRLETKMLLGNTETRAAISTQEQRFEQHVDHLLDQLLKLRRDDHDHWYEADTRLNALADSHAAIDAKQDAILAAILEVAADQKKHASDIHALDERMRASEADRVQIHQELTEIKTLLADRPVERAKEHADLVNEVMRRIAERDGDVSG